MIQIDATRGGRPSSSETRLPGSIAAAARAAWLDRAGVSAALIAGSGDLRRPLHHALHQPLRARLRHHRDRRHAPLLAGSARLPPRRAALVLLPAPHAAVRAHRRALWGRRDDHRRRAGSAGWDRPGNARTALRLPDLSCHLVHRHLPRALLGRREDALAGHPHRAAGDACWPRRCSARRGSAGGRSRTPSSMPAWRETPSMREAWAGRGWAAPQWALFALLLGAGSLLVSRRRAHDLWRVRLRRGHRRLGARADPLGAGALVVAGVATSRRHRRGRP